MKNIEYILEFATGLGREMLLAGANLERVTDTMQRICYSYELKDISLFAMSNTLILTASTQEGEKVTRHVQVPDCGTNLSKLTRYHALSKRVCKERPHPVGLSAMLREAGLVEDYPGWMVLLGYIVALCSICRLFGGGFGEIAAVAISTVVMYGVINFLTEQRINRIIKDAACMFVAGSLAIFYVKLGLSQDYFTIVLTNAFMMIPGLQMVNAARNILCGNEANGVIELLKVVLETGALVIGIVVSMELFGGLITW